MADPVWLDGVTPLNAVNMTKLQTRDEKAAASGYPSLDSGGKVPTAQIPDLTATYQPLTQKAQVNGYASLGSDGKVPAGQLPPAPAGITWEGAWAGGTAYQAGDVVSYNGRYWLAVQGSTGSAPA